MTDISFGFNFALGFVPVLFVFLALLSLLTRNNVPELIRSENQRREEAEYRRGFSDGLETTSREQALQIINESIEQKISSLCNRPGRNPAESGNASPT